MRIYETEKSTRGYFDWNEVDRAEGLSRMDWLIVLLGSNITDPDEFNVRAPAVQRFVAMVLIEDAVARLTKGNNLINVYERMVPIDNKPRLIVRKADSSSLLYLQQDRLFLERSQQNNPEIIGYLDRMTIERGRHLV